MSRLVAIDLGRARIGLAVGESNVRIVSPRSPLRPTGTLAKDADLISTFAKKEEAAKLIVGAPFGPDGGETPGSRAAKRLAELLGERGWDVEIVDETSTSAEAEEAMRDAGLKGSQRRKASDGEAACRIMERFFAEKT